MRAETKCHLNFTTKHPTTMLSSLKPPIQQSKTVGFDGFDFFSSPQRRLITSGQLYKKKPPENIKTDEKRGWKAAVWQCSGRRNRLNYLPKNENIYWYISLKGFWLIIERSDQSTSLHSAVKSLSGSLIFFFSLLDKLLLSLSFIKHDSLHLISVLRLRKGLTLYPAGC